MRAWLNDELDSMVEERVVSRVLDLGGGERVIAEFTRDLSLPSCCSEYGIRLVAAFFLGPDPEDLRHTVEVVRSGDLAGSHVLLVLNEGIVQQGQSTEAAFTPIISDPSFVELLDRGARLVFMRRLSCLRILRERNAGFYDVAVNARDRDGARRFSPILHHLTTTWLKELEEQHQRRGVVDWLP